MTVPAALPGKNPASTIPLTGILLAAAGAVAFSGKAIIVKLAYRYHVDAVTLIALRMAFSLPLFGLAALWMQRKAGQATLATGDWWKIMLLGFLGYYLSSFLDFLGLQYVTATLERLILYLNPTIVLLLSALLFKRRISARQVVAMLISYCGVVLAFAHDLQVGGSNIVLGSVLVLASALAYALYLIGSGELVKRVGSIRLVAYASSVACACCILQFLLLRPLTALDLPWQVYALSVLNAVVCTVLPVFAVMIAVARIGASVAAQIGMVGPMSTIILSALFLGETMGAWQVAGTVLVMSGVFVVSRSRTPG